MCLQLITFDAGGISGHANHKALFEGVRCVHEGIRQMHDKQRPYPSSVGTT